ncbi:hypothetical protein, partial [uncultured Desulfovibrio sp.]|uniref:hypothetical protein n=1 Tax=uncultured Desulfovibrio sp. TaxID=167968 RepID=UPI002620FD9A
MIALCLKVGRNKAHAILTGDRVHGLGDGDATLFIAIILTDLPNFYSTMFSKTGTLHGMELPSSKAKNVREYRRLRAV